MGFHSSMYEAQNHMVSDVWRRLGAPWTIKTEEKRQMYSTRLSVGLYLTALLPNLLRAQIQCSPDSCQADLSAPSGDR